MPRIEQREKMRVEISPSRFSENLRWLLKEGKIRKSAVGRKAFGARLTAEAGRKRICRLLNGHVELKVHDVEVLANIFGIHPAVLLYGTEEQLEKSWRER